MIYTTKGAKTFLRQKEFNFLTGQQFVLHKPNGKKWKLLRLEMVEEIITTKTRLIDKTYICLVLQ